MRINHMRDDNRHFREIRQRTSLLIIVNNRVETQRYFPYPRFDGRRLPVISFRQTPRNDFRDVVDPALKIEEKPLINIEQQLHV